jgi:hypothetical protein
MSELDGRGCGAGVGAAASPLSGWSTVALDGDDAFTTDCAGNSDAADWAE